MYTDAELSQRRIDKLLELWAATLIPHNDSPPITNHRDLHQQIDAIELGSVSWENISLKYNGPLPETTRRPEWMTREYDVWYRDPRQIIKNILARPELDGHVDYVAYQEFNGEQRQYGNLMSGNWAWRQSVCSTDSVFSNLLITSFNRTPLPRTQKPMAPCSFQLSWDQMRRRSRSPPVKTIFTPYISRSVTSKTISDVHTRMRSC